MRRNVTCDVEYGGANFKEGDKVVSGNFRAIRDLKDGQRVKITKKAEKK